MINRILLLTMSIVLLMSIASCSKIDTQSDNQPGVSSSFEVDSTFEHDGFIFHGKKDRIGLSNLTGETQTIFISGKKDIFFWRFFGPVKLGDKITIKATNPKGNETIDILNIQRDSVETPLLSFLVPTGNGLTDTGMQIQEDITSQRITSKGLWKFDVYFDNKYFDSVVILFE